MESKAPLVSMITYCYNGERFVHKYFEALLAQDYENVELIFFNNGSSDRTGEIAESYIDRIEGKGYLFKLIHYRDNQSTCQLKQDGFRMMKGEYFFGCDSDDLIDPGYISEMVHYLQEHRDKGIVFCQLRVVEEESGELKKIMKMIPRTGEKEAFIDILNATNTNFTAISYMMSRKHFEEVNPEKKIFISRYGENYQMLMPFLYHDLQGYIEKPLGQYTVRRDSYTGRLTADKQVRALKGNEKSVRATLDQIGAETEYYSLFLARIRKDLFYSSLLGTDRRLAKKCYREYRDVKKPTQKDRLAWVLYCAGLYKTVFRVRHRGAFRCFNHT